MAKPLVFISYRSTTAATIKPIVQAVLDRGCRVFIDYPENFGYDAAEATRAGIEWISGQSWRLPLRDKLAECDAVLFCLSQGFDVQERVVWREEFVAAHMANKLVACTIDETMPGDLGQEAGTAQTTGLAQIEDVSARRVITPDGTLDHNTLSFVLSDLDAILARAAIAAPVAAIVETGMAALSSTELNKVVPLSVDVDVQSNFSDVFEIAASTATLCPLIVMAPESEQIEGFIDAHLTQDVPKRRINPRRLGSEADRPTNVITNATTEANDPQFARTMTDHLRMILMKDLPDTEYHLFDDFITPEQRITAIATGFRMLAAPRVPLVCVSAPLSIETMKPKHRATINAWAGLWQKIGEEVADVSLVPILPIVMTGHPAGWQRKKKPNKPCYPTDMFSLRKCRNGVFHAHVIAMEAEFGVRVVGVVPPVEEGRATEWGRGLHDTVLSQVQKAFAARGARKRGLTMRDFRKTMVGG